MQRKKTIFIAAIGLLLAASFLATSLISYHIARDSVASHLKEQMLPLTSDNVYSEIQRDLVQPLLISSLMAHDTFVLDWAAGGELDQRKMTGYLDKIQKKYGTITTFYVSQKTLRYYHPTGVIKTMDPADKADAWFFRLADFRNEYEINIDRDTADRSRLNIFVNYRVLDAAGRFIAATGVGLSVESVIRLIEEYQSRYGRKIYFVNRKGEVTLHGSSFGGSPRLQDRDGLNRLSVRILTSPSASITYTERDGSTIYLNSRLVPEFDWFLIVEQAGNPSSERLEHALVINVLLSLGITLLVLFTTYFSVRGYQRRLEAMATQDKLTGAASRQIFDLIFAHAEKTARRKNAPLSIVSMDIDRFKEINDTYGHQCGDGVLRTFADLARSAVREGDTLCRWGGEEFLLLLEDCDLEHALRVSNTIRTSLKKHDFHSGRDVFKVTASFGAAQHAAGESLDALVGRSDRALYEAKRGGRDRICAAA